ncbi:MAG: 5-oxoprolinase [Gammaproteobacteria bacterium]|nr:5-oxoprolinase [Gammaproteobacteria bacterium]
MSDGRWQFWIDRGGTFTDVIACSPDGALTTRKLLSVNPRRYKDAAVAGICQILGLPEDETTLPAERLAAVKMGTTIATNALLEREGAKTVLVTTHGFGDALRIGYQNRPDIFARQVVLPDLLHSEVIEASERIAADGTVLAELDHAALESKLRAVRASGIDAAAIVFMHAWRYPQHEVEAAEIARACGFSQVSVSHEVGALIKLVGRGDTTVVDAYLSPLIRNYVNGITSRLGIETDAAARLMFMQSSGGLTDAGRFRGKDAILSGPAAGVVGMAQTAARLGESRVIGFDMGGTSTDVSLYDGHYERSYETHVAGVRLRAPMMQIHTVAAGGGSVLRYADGRMQVGPASAGADPGPACYRNDGPLTLTDANVMLGRLRPEYFPAVFGADGDEPLDVTVVQERFGQLAKQITAAGSTPVDAATVASGFVRIAVQTMANAIRRISTRRGHDTRDFTLGCFGGAGGQHACQVADAIGATRILVHPLAGLMSAYGMGLADLRGSRQQTVGIELTETGLAGLASQVAAMAGELAAEMHDQQVAVEHQSTTVTLLVRYRGADTALPVPAGECSAVEQQFSVAHQQLFGFTLPSTAAVIDSVEVGIVGRTAQPVAQLTATGTQPARPAAFHPVVFAGEQKQTPFFRRDQLAAKQQISGPAVIVEDNATTLVEPGWQADVLPEGSLLLQRTAARPPAHAAGTDADPVLLEIFNHLFMHIAEQMGAVLARTAKSVNIKERLDFSCAVFDTSGSLVANAPHMPVHLGSMGESVRAVIAANGKQIRAGDVYALNAPYNGGTHLPDITVVTPVFSSAGERLFFVASRGHHADIGGITPGSMPPDSTHVDQEGILIDNFLLVRDGRFREAAVRELLGSGRWTARDPDQNVADLKAQVAANERGVSELRAAIGHHGLATVRAYMQHVQDNAAASVRRVISKLRNGSFRYELDNGLHIQVAIRVDRDSGTAEIDFDGTSPQSDSNFNAPLPVCRAAVLYVFRTLVDDPIPMNAGCMRHIRLLVPQGSLLDPAYPAAVVAGNVETSQCIVDALYGALGVMAAAQGTMNNLTFGNERYQYYETICGGTGAGPGFAGTAAVHSHMTNSRLTDPEILEWRYPVVVREFALRPDSGGAGRWRGGDGVRRVIEAREPMSLSILSNHRRVAPFGLAGGGQAATGRNCIRRSDGTVEELGSTATAAVSAGDAIIIETPGGGGYGRP